jgi:tRNA modification GTPase
MNNRTICAISTPLGNAAISIIRMSGNRSLEIAKKYFSANGLDYEKIIPRYAYLGDFLYENISERCLMLYFQAPNSYTGEDIIEFHIHGGEFLSKKFLEILMADCELANPGEFSKRAFINGKLSLSEAEGIIDVINSESEAELSSAYALSTGRFNLKIVNFQERLTELLAKIEVALDYPEHDEELITARQVEEGLKEINSEIIALIENSESGAKIKSGVNVAIVGSPNVGKSSLLNALLEKDRAIVSPIAGTTRDTISESLTYKGIKFNLTDTAGIREGTDEIEKVGVERAKREIENADIILFVSDLNKGLTFDEESLLKTLDRKKVVLILNKLDVKRKNTVLPFESIEISALKGINIDKIKEIMYDKFFKGKIDLSKIVLTNLRHINILRKCREDIDNTLQLIKEVTLDVLAFEIKKIWDDLGRITGETENENIINEIFSKFCLGK